MQRKELNEIAQKSFNAGGVFVPSPLALDENKNLNEAYQRLLALYYIKAGARSVIPGAHTGEFALNNLEVLDKWLLWIKEISREYGENLTLMCMVGGKDSIKQAELAAKHKYDAVMVAPTAFAGTDEDSVISLFETIASIIPTFAFELQRLIPGSYAYTPELWSRIFDIVYGAKGASFNTYSSLVMLEAAAKSGRKESLTLFTGNDDRIVSDLLGEFSFQKGECKSTVYYKGGLLGHFATDTHAAVNWVNAIMAKRKKDEWSFNLPEIELSHGVNRCNMALFDALGDFENSVWGVKYRLSSLGLLPGPYCMHEKGRPGQSQSINYVYNEYPELNDNEFVAENIEWMKKEVGIKL